MAPLSLSSIYQQYKADTDLVANWLGTTAKQHGYGTNKQSNGKHKNNKKKGGGGGGGRNKPRQQPNTNPHGLPPELGGIAPTKPKYVLKICDFEPMASFLAAVEAIKVPDYFAVAIERVIWVRRSFAGRLAENGTKVNVGSDERHGHFVDVLEKVRDHLKPHIDAGSVYNMEEMKKAAMEMKTSTDPLKNVFSILDVYEPSEAFLNAPDVEIPKRPQLEYIAEEEDTLYDAIFALTTLLHDYDRLRDEVRSLWVRYEKGELDLATVSVATNTAFEFARGMEDEIKPLLEKHRGGMILLNAYFIALCRDAGIEATRVQRAGDAYNLLAYPIAQTCLMNTASALNGYGQANSNKSIITNYNGKFGWYDEKLGANGVTYREKCDQDKTALFEILPDLQWLTSNVGRGGVVEDELIRGMDEMMEKPGSLCRLWFAWAIQIYLDIVQNLGENCGRGHGDLRRESAKIKKAMVAVSTDVKERRPVLGAATKWDRDPMMSTRDKMMKFGSMNKTPLEEFKFLRRNPLHCGLWIHKIRTTFHGKGVEYAARPGALMVAVQLYHALRQEELLPKGMDWADLDVFWHMQGNSTFFVGDPPTTREGYFKNYCLSIGSSISNWAPTKRSKKVAVNQDNRRNMRFKGWTSLTMSERLHPHGDRSPFDTEMIEKILKLGDSQDFVNKKGHVKADKKKEAEEADAKLANLTPVALIRRLAKNIDWEIPDLMFDYFAMHRSALQLYGMMKEEFIRRHGPIFNQSLPQEDLLPFVVGMVFATADGRKGMQKEDEGRDHLLEAARDVLCKFLEEGKGRVVMMWMANDADPDEQYELNFEDDDPWGIDEMMKGLRKEVERAGRTDLLDQCPVQ